MGKLACAGGRAREGQSFCAAELQSDGLRLVSFEGEGTEHVGCLVAPSLARLKSFHHSLARSLTTTRPAEERASFLSSSPPLRVAPSLPTITRLRLSTPAVLAVKWVVVCLQERWAIPAAQTFPPVTKGRPPPRSSPPKTKGRCRLLLTLHSSAKLMVIGNTEHLIVLPVKGSLLKTRSEHARLGQFQTRKRDG